LFHDRVKRALRAQIGREPARNGLADAVEIFFVEFEKPHLNEQARAANGAPRVDFIGASGCRGRRRSRR